MPIIDFLQDHMPVVTFNASYCGQVLAAEATINPPRSYSVRGGYAQGGCVGVGFTPQGQYYRIFRRALQDHELEQQRQGMVQVESTVKGELNGEQHAGGVAEGIHVAE